MSVDPNYTSLSDKSDNGVYRYTLQMAILMETNPKKEVFYGGPPSYQPF